MRKITSLLIIVALIFSQIVVFADSSNSVRNENVNAKSFNTAMEENKDKKISDLELVSINSYTDKGLEVEEYFYKVQVNDLTPSSLSNSISPLSTGPEEGDFKIVIVKGTLSGKDWFDEVEGYRTYLATEASYDAMSIMTGFVSNPVLSFFLGDAVALIENGMKGSGLAYSVERTVQKWGQIYHNGSWIDYYRGTQLEVYWGQQMYVYDTTPGNIGTVLFNKTEDYNESRGYNPIFVDASKYFRNNNMVYQLALASYQSNGYWYGDSGSVKVYTGSWKTGVSKNY